MMGVLPGWFMSVTLLLTGLLGSFTARLKPAVLPPYVWKSVTRALVAVSEMARVAVLPRPVCIRDRACVPGRGMTIQ